MKGIFLFVASILVCGFVKAAGIPTMEVPINNYGTPARVSITTYSWTKIPTTQTSGRAGVLIHVPTGNTGEVMGHLGNCTSTAISTTTWSIRFLKTDPDTEHVPIREDICLWLLTTHTAAENIHYQETIR
jgi:hypothetical protein